jgi:metal-responsive CopG/Arc/MetJ family transcriptional regulator
MSTVTTRDLDAVLFVKVEASLLERLDRIAADERKRRRGMGMTRSDVVRSILWEAIHERERIRRGETQRQE